MHYLKKKKKPKEEHPRTRAGQISIVGLPFHLLVTHDLLSICVYLMFVPFCPQTENLHRCSFMTG